MLNVIEHGTSTAQPGLLIAHGLFGSARNWGVIAKRLADSRKVLAVDMRNHGSSPWHDSHGYADLAGDLAGVLTAQAAPHDILAHSMGGKAAMMLALRYPHLVNRLIVVDIAPVAYDHSQAHNVAALKAVDLSAVSRRSDAAPLLEAQLEDPALVPFFLQSLDVAAKRWVLNLDVLAAEMPKILGFPDIEATYEGRTLFLSGGQSAYVGRADRGRIKALFPRAQFMRIPGAGHWVHAEKPREFEAAVRQWLA